MSRRFTLADAVTALSVAALAALSLGVALKAPAGPLPMHFDLQGRPDRWGDRTELASVLAGLSLLAAVLGGAMSWFAGRSTDAARERGLRLGQWLTAPVIAAVGGLVAWAILDSSSTPGAALLPMGWLMAGLGALLAGVGAVLGRMPPNPVAGVRTPWSFKSRLAWDRSNRLAGRLMFWIGLAALIAAPLVPQPAGLMGLVVAVLIAAGLSIFESWRVWRDDPDRQPF